MVDNIVVFWSLLVVMMENLNPVLVPNAPYMRATALMFRPALDAVPERSRLGTCTPGNALLGRFRERVRACCWFARNALLESHSVAAHRCLVALGPAVRREQATAAFGASGFSHLPLVLSVRAGSADMNATR